jgi:hypothetical protein
MSGVPLQDVADLAAAIAEFQDRLPGWWWSVGTCSVSRDASCGPDVKGSDAHLLTIPPFHEPFNCDDREGTAAGSLRWVMAQALEAKASLSATLMSGRTK